MKRISIALIAFIAACTTQKSAPVDTAASVESRKTVSPSAPPEKKPVVGQWDVTSKGIGRLTSGTRIQDAHLALNTLPFDSPGIECTFVLPHYAPRGVRLMFVDGIFARVDVTSGIVKTVQGAHIGTTEDELNTIYKGRIVTQPAKYGPGHTLVVTPPENDNNRIVFETDGKKVTRFRSGQLPQVEWVEGCG